MEQWRMKDEGEVVEWFPAPNGGYVGIIKGDDGGVYSAKSDDCETATDAGRITKGTRVRYSTQSFKNQQGGDLVGTDCETGEKYSAGAARDISLAP